MPFQKRKMNRRCILCNSRSLFLLYPSTLGKPINKVKQYVCTTTSYGVHGPIYKCRRCGFVFIIDNESKKNIKINYEEVEDPLYISEKKARTVTFKRHLKNILRYSRKKGKLLEVGSYTGLFLSIAKRAGWDVYGVEPSKWAVKYAKKNYWLNIKNTILKSGIFPPGIFDVIVMWDVIEHIPNPLNDLKVCYSYLKPGGHIIMSTINIDSLISKMLGPKWPWLMDMHRVYFSESTMKKMLEKVGFVDIDFRPHVRYVSLRYLMSRFMPIKEKKLSFLGKLIIPFYIGDLFDISAKKPKQ